MVRCRINIPGRQKRKFDTDERTLVDALTKRFTKFKRAASQTPRAIRDRAAQQLVRDTVVRYWINNTADVIRLFPQQGNRLMDFLVTDFGQKAKKMGLDPSRDYTLAGEVRYGLEDYQQVSEGMINLAGRIQSLKKINEFVETVKSLTADKDISLEQQRRLQVDALELGRIPETLSNEVYYKIEQDGNYSSPVSKYLMHRYNKFIQTLEDYGFQPNEVSELIDKSQEVSRVFTEVRAIATAMGVDIPDMRNLGYFTRVITDDFKMRLKDLDYPELLQEIKVGTNELSTVFAKSRSTVHFVPYDLDIASRLLDITTDELAVLLDNPNEFRKYLHENLTTDQLDALVDSGVFEKLPMSSTEVYDYFINQYELPYRSINDMFVVDPFRAVQKYTSSLQEAAGNSALIRGIVDGRARSAGWAVSREVVMSNPSVYSDFVPLGDYLDRWAIQAKISTAQVIQRLGMGGSEVQISEILKTFKDTYVHPVVANQWSGLMALSSNPAMMSTVAGMAQRAMNVFNKLIISGSNTVYVLNNALGSAIQTIAGGGNIARLPVNFINVIKAMKYGLEAFDDTRPYLVDNGVTLTQRQFWEKFLIKRGQALTPGITKTPYDLNIGSLSDFARLMLDTPVSFAHAIQDIITYTMAKGNMVNGRTIQPWERVGRLTNASMRKMYAGIDSMFGPLALISNIFETAAKATILETVMKKASGLDEAASTAAQLMLSWQFRKIDSFEEAFRHLDDYFVNAYSIGRFTKWAGSFILPFATWRMMNPPMQIRHMFRNPALYISYHRLHALNQEDLSQDDRAIEAAIEPWLLEAEPWYIGRDLEGKPMMLLADSFDPILDGYKFTKGVLNATGGFLGYKGSKSAAKLREEVRGETTQDFLNSLVQQTFPPVRGLIEFMTGVDSFTNRRVDEGPLAKRPDFLGINLPSRLVLLLQKLPILSRLDAMNPFELFGRAPLVSPLTGEILVPGRPSIFGGERTRRDTRLLTYEDAPLFQKILIMSGMNIRSIDYDRNLQNTYGDLNSTISYLEDNLNKTREQLVKETEQGVINRAEFERRRTAVYDLMSVWGQLLTDKMRLGVYMKQHNVTPKDVLSELDRKRIQVRQLPLPGDEQLDEIAQKIIKVNQELNELEKKLND